MANLEALLEFSISINYKMKNKDWKNSVYPVRVEYGLYIIIYI